MKKFVQLICLIFLLSTAQAQAQDKREISLTALPPQFTDVNINYDVTQLDLLVEIDGPKANCTLKYVIENKGTDNLEMDFLAPLPQGGAVSGLMLMAGGKEMPGNIYDKEQAAALYQQIVSSLKDPALLEYAGRDTFRARIFPIAPKSKSTLELKMEYLLPKDNNRTSFIFPLASPLTQDRNIASSEVLIKIKNNPGLKNIYTPLEGTELDERGSAEAVVKFKQKNSNPLDKFELFYQTEQTEMGGLVLSYKPEKNEDGFFLFLAEPDLQHRAKQEKINKDVVFVLDTSGSMAGNTFDQALEATKFVLERLDDNDKFNLTDYADEAHLWQKELVPLNKQNRTSALKYLDDLRATGGTNISDALQKSYTLLKKNERPSYILLMTDGEPTEGETDELKLAELAQKVRPAQKTDRLFVFGVGNNVNSRLLDRLSGQAGGTSVFVKPEENIEAKVSEFFSKMESPALTRPQLKIDTSTNRLSPKQLPDIFLGGQLVVVGRYPRGGEAKFTLSGRLGTETVQYDYQVNLSDEATEGGDFIARLWANRRIGEILDEIDLAGKPNQELLDELLELSKRYGILTPYTSFLALEEQNLNAKDELEQRASENLSALDAVVGAEANEQRQSKSDYKTMEKPKAAPAMGSAMSQSAIEDMGKFDKSVAAASPASINLPQNWGGETFYLKNGQWQDSRLKEKEIKAAQSIKKFSPEYFALAKNLRPDQLIWLSQKEPVMFSHNGQSYLIEQ